MSNDAFEETYLAKGWDETDKALKDRQKENSTWLRLEDGESIQLNVVGKPEAYEKAFKPGDPPKPRVKVDVYLPDIDGLKIWDMSKTVYEDLKMKRDRRPDFSDALIEVGRKGTGKDNTKYWIEYIRQLNDTEKTQRDNRLAGGGPVPF